MLFHYRRNKISIHEAAKASTCSRKYIFQYTYISIHEAAKASTSNSKRVFPGHNFNPRSRKGFDASSVGSSACTNLFQSTKPQRLRHGHAIPLSDYQFISIHEAAKASTSNRKVCLNKIWFQSTKPQRLRRFNRIRTNDNIQNFNPRSRKGFDLILKFCFKSW